MRITDKDKMGSWQNAQLIKGKGISALNFHEGSKWLIWEFPLCFFPHQHGHTLYKNFHNF